MRGEPYQFFLNTPWGDQAFKKSLVGFFSAGAGLPRGPKNQYAKSYTSFSSRFRFNGKEWDEETGNFYYGARYYDPKISVWLSVDPLAHKYPSLSPYTFVANNPIMLVDPDGRQIDPAGSEEKGFLRTWVQINFGENSGIKVRNNSVKINKKKFEAALENMDEPTRELATAFQEVVEDDRTVTFKLGEEMTVINSARTGKYTEENIGGKTVNVPQIIQRNEPVYTDYGKTRFLGEKGKSLDNHGILINPNNHFHENGYMENKYSTFSHEIGHMSLFFQGIDLGSLSHQSTPIFFENVTRMKLGLGMRHGVTHEH